MKKELRKNTANYFSTKDTKQGKKKNIMRVQHSHWKESLNEDAVNVETGVLSQHNVLRKSQCSTDIPSNSK